MTLAQSASFASGAGLVSTGVLSASRSDAHLLTVTFDHAPAHSSIDVRPALPLVLEW